MPTDTSLYSQSDPITLDITKAKFNIIIAENNYNYFKIQIINDYTEDLNLYIKESKQPNYNEKIQTIDPQQQTYYQQNWQNNQTTIILDIKLENKTTTIEQEITIERPNQTTIQQPTIINKNNNNQYIQIQLKNNNNLNVYLYVNNTQITTLAPNQIYTYTENWNTNEETKELKIYLVEVGNTDNISATTTINLTIPTTQKSEYEVINIPEVMLYIITMPFTFYSQAFNFTLFTGTPYAINIGQLILGIIGSLLMIWLIFKVMKVIK